MTTPPRPPLPAAPLTPAPPTAAVPPRVYYRARSLFPGLALIVIGGVLLANSLRPNFDLAYVITHYWPVMIILWGLCKLIDHLRHRAGFAPPSLITGGEAALIVVLVAVVCLAMAGNWARQRIPGDLMNQIAPFMQTASRDFQADSAAIPPGSQIEISSPNGDITVRPGSAKTIHAVAHATTSAPTDDEARRMLNDGDLTITSSGGVWLVRPRTDRLNKNLAITLQVDVPAQSTITVKANRGDVNVSGIRGDVMVPTHIHHLEIHDIVGNVTANATDGDSHIRNVSGSVTLAGRGNGNLEIANVQGSASVSGNLFGNMHFAAIAKNVHYQSQRTTVDLGALPGEMTIPDIQITHAMGGATISAQNRDIRLNRIDGPLSVNDVHGDITVTYNAAPKAAVDLNNDSGDITLSLPGRSSFALSAWSKSGSITNDVVGNASTTSDHNGPAHIETSSGSGSPIIRLTTRFGDIHIRKSD